MKILILGYGKEGQSVEIYIAYKGAEIVIIKSLDPAHMPEINYSSYDIIFRSPSVPPIENLPNLSSVTKYFFDHCPCRIIGVTATKGKGTTCSFIKSLLDAAHEDAYLIGNIGTPAIDVLDNLKPSSVVVYEMSSFQLWDLKKSPSISVIGTIEPDHLNVHNGYDDYLNAKANIGRFQTETDTLIYFKNNPDSTKLANISSAKKIAYPFEIPDEIKSAITLPGEHNINNAIAAIAAVASYKNISPDEYLKNYSEEIIKGLKSFHGLPHRLEFVCEIDGIKIYDDNFSTNPASTKVAIDAFPSNDLVVIIGGRDKTDNQDLPEIYETICSANVKKIILLGESGHLLEKTYSDPRFEVAESLEDAVKKAYASAQNIKSTETIKSANNSHDSAKNSHDSASNSHDSVSNKHQPVILMSPSAASFDMFENVYDRGEKFQKLVHEL